MSLLECKNMVMRFGGLTAVNNFSLTLEKNDLHGIIGPNGAGKTTAFNMITGVYTPTAGEVFLKGRKLNNLRPYTITQTGIARTFQNIRLFKDLTALDNLRIAAHFRTEYRLWDSLLRTKRFKKEEQQIEESAMQLLKIFDLDKQAHQLSKNLPYGKQRRLEMARAMATRPEVLLLDEPAAGMNPNETAELTNLIKWIRDEFNIAILLIEHDMKLVMKVCERITVFDHGETIATGNPSEIQGNPKVIEAYLGKDDE